MATTLFIEYRVQANNKENNKAQHWWPFVRGIPSQRISNADSNPTPASCVCRLIESQRAALTGEKNMPLYIGSQSPEEFIEFRLACEWHAFLLTFAGEKTIPHSLVMSCNHVSVLRMCLPNIFIGRRPLRPIVFFFMWTHWVYGGADMQQ